MSCYQNNEPSLEDSLELAIKFLADNVDINTLTLIKVDEKEVSKNIDKIFNFWKNRYEKNNDIDIEYCQHQDINYINYNCEKCKDIKNIKWCKKECDFCEKIYMERCMYHIPEYYLNVVYSQDNLF